MVCRIHLPIIAVWLTFPNIQAAYTLKGWLYVLLGKGYKSTLYLWGKRLQSGYKMLFENIALFSLPLNGIFLFLQLEVIILDLDPANSFVKKDQSGPVSCVQQEKISTAGPGNAGRCFYQEDKE